MTPGHRTLTFDSTNSPHADQETLNYLHAYISFSYRKGKPYLSVYLQTFETGDWPICKCAAVERRKWNINLTDIVSQLWDPGGQASP